MLGHRGCRLGISYPEITAMQARGDLRGGLQRALRKLRKTVKPEVMIPLVATGVSSSCKERIVRETASEVFAERQITCALPRRHDDRAAARGAVRRRDRRARRVLLVRHQRPDADDLGASPATMGRFIPHYIEHEIFPDDPFAGARPVRGVGS
jgi:pyruvate,orthophosphate dikinase